MRQKNHYNIRCGRKYLRRTDRDHFKYKLPNINATQRKEPSDPKQLKALGMTIVDYIKTKQKAPTEMERDSLRNER